MICNLNLETPPNSPVQLADYYKYSDEQMLKSDYYAPRGKVVYYVDSGPWFLPFGAAIRMYVFKNK